MSQLGVLLENDLSLSVVLVAPEVAVCVDSALRRKPHSAVVVIMTGLPSHSTRLNYLNGIVFGEYTN